MRILATGLSYNIRVLSSVLFFSMRWMGKGYGCTMGGGKSDSWIQRWEILTCHFFVWFVHGLELLQQSGGGKDVG